MEAELLQDVEPTIQEVKRGLPVEYVLARAGHPISAEGSAICPFHNDHSPSLDVFGENRWNCAPCGRGGDVIDLLLALAPGMTFPDAMRWAARLMREHRESGGSGPVLLEKQPFDVAAGSAAVAFAFEEFGSHDTVGRLIDHRGWDFRADWLHESWGVGDDGRIVIPYWSANGELRTYRTRGWDTKPQSAVGTHLPTFYGEWRASGAPQVIICEGESDTWAVDYALDHEDIDTDVFGVPGAGRPPFGADLLRGASVILAFDGDPAGRAATVRWREYLTERGITGRVINLPDGRDMASYQPVEIAPLLLG